MSVPIIATGLFACCVVVSLIIAIPLQTAGYNHHKEINGDLITTQCKITDWLITPNTCYESCNCYTTCVPNCITKTVNGHTTTSCTQTCARHCSSCPFICYDASWEFSYTLKSDTNNTLLTTLKCGSSYRSQLLAQSDLNTKPIGAQYVCFYDGEDVGLVLFSKYDLTGFLVSYIFILRICWYWIDWCLCIFGYCVCW